MLYRPIFVTNSSSSCTLVYGIKLSSKELDNLLRVLCRKFPEQALEFVKQNLRDDQQELLFAPEEDFIEAAHDDLYDFGYPFLPKDVNIVRGEDDDDYWIDLNGPLDGEVQGDKVVLTKLDAKEVAFLIALAKEAGVKNTTLQADYWEEYN